MSEFSNPVVKYKYRLICYGPNLIIKGLYDIKSYDDTLVVLKCGVDIIALSGSNIEINLLDADEIRISGNIADIQFSRGEM